MKIIGHTGGGSGCGLLVEMTRQELAHIAGRQWTQAKWDERYETEMHCHVGKEYKVAKIWAHLIGLSAIVREMLAAKKTIEAVTSLLELPPCLTEITEAIEKDRANPA